MIVVKKEVNKDSEIIEIENNFRLYQKIVGGYFETLPLGNNILAVINEDGLNINLPYNFSVKRDNYMVQPIVGNAVFVSFNGEDDFTSLNDEQLVLLKEMKLLKEETLNNYTNNKTVK